MSDDEARALRATIEEQRAVIERIRTHVGVWLHDKRMRIAGEILLAEIDRIQAEEAERTRRGDRA